MASANDLVIEEYELYQYGKEFASKLGRVQAQWDKFMQTAMQAVQDKDIEGTAAEKYLSYLDIAKGSFDKSFVELGSENQTQLAEYRNAAQTADEVAL